METVISTYEQQAIDFLKATNTEFKSEFLRFDSMPFDTNGEKRNIFKITLSNDRHKYSFEFGSSINDSWENGSMLHSNEKTEIYVGFRSSVNSNIWFSLNIKTDYPTLLAISEGRRELAINDADLKKSYSDYVDRVDTATKKVKHKKGGIHVPMSLERIQSEYITNAVNSKINEAKLKQTKFPKQADTIKHPTAYDVLACVTKWNPGTFENFCSEFGYDEDSRRALKTYKAVCKEWRNISKLFTETELEQLQEIN
jgi:hypothetical protein